MFIDENETPASWWVSIALKAIRAVTLVFDILTFPIHLVLQKPWRKRALSRRIKATIIESTSNSITVRSVSSPCELHTRLVRDGVTTMESMLRAAAARWVNKPCLGTRQLLGEEDEPQPNGRIFKKFKMGNYEWRTYTEMEREAKHFGAGLRELGCQPVKNVVMFAETRAEWMIAAHGCFKQSIPVVTIYATLGDDAIAHGINETEVSTVITTHDLLPKFRKILVKTPKVDTIIYMEDQLKPTDREGFKPGIRIVGYKEVMQMGKGSSIDNVPPSPKDTAIIMYTSGSTGVPKGVILSHRNMVATLKAFADSTPIFENDVLMGFLPLAHVFELLAESLCIIAGVPIGYSTPLTMLDSSSKIMRGTNGDATTLRPTCITTVPLIMDRISKGITDKVSRSGAFANAFFKWAYTYKQTWMRRGYDTPILNRIMFTKITALLGGRLRLMIAGGAPLSPDTHTQIRVCLCCDVVAGYGLTETTSSATVMDPHDRSTGRVGAPCTGTDIKLVNWEEGNYRVSNKPFPQGEIVIGGDNVAEGYYRNPEKTREEFVDMEGRRWFRSGDIGELHHDGCIKIIDRKKDLVKLQAGEYVSLGKVEAELKTCPIVENICVYGDSSKTYTVALLVPNPQHLAELAARIGLPDMDFEQLCNNSEIEKAVVKELADHARKCGLEKFEVPAAVKLCTEVWTPDMGLVTAAFKIKRKDIQERYKEDIKRMYAS
ncbi:long-chain-fatty-acid--CoA ligase 4 [Hyposmocoma kahamanoa]|uniref:long-chain-fatty-acid--CoA ligase 4 n=1 Tax=Hyposmocoma kahamanoa TaxID=1477025 RepID=UPI000E6D9BEA|nr:long-chain-fatty-acid--CoA ligase 4 [Hyposmocoma kahamanoa]XP_026314423.1 long-chain-fatty-acid--CoA ligase 4 [Hyposmocoma kahamanoa]XP_026314424.1 long-chain-fatty-acid--CoA ligase 4 [Hyposmocoma kahamanoa]